MMKAFSAAALICCLHGSATGDLVLRNGVVIEAPIESVGVEGVAVGGDAPRVVGWDLVYYATGERAAEVAAYRDWSDGVWRAKSRLSRGDLALASELFDELFERLQSEGVAGPTGLVIAEGALRCRVAENRHSDAIEAWAAALRIRATGQRQSGESGAGGVIDARTLLVPTLPPMWLEGSSEAAQIYERLGEEDLGENANELLELYRLSAGLDTGRPPHGGIALGVDRLRHGSGGKRFPSVCELRRDGNC